MRDDAPEITPALLLQAYASGVFPMAEGAGSEELFWVDPRAARHPAARRAARPAAAGPELSRGDFEIRVDGDFSGVVAACAEREETWINAADPRGSTATCTGWAMPIRSRSGARARWPAGSTGWRSAAAFFGESMFSRRRDASKFALIALVARLRAGGFRLLDTQFVTPHLARLGAIEISRAAYHRELEAALARPADFLALAPDASRQSLLQLSTQTS